MIVDNPKNTKPLSEFERVDIQYFTDLKTIISAKRTANVRIINLIYKYLPFSTFNKKAISIEMALSKYGVGIISILLQHQLLLKLFFQSVL